MPDQGKKEQSSAGYPILTESVDPIVSSTANKVASNQRSAHIALLIITVLMLAVLAILSNRHVTWPADHFTDMNVLMSGENLSKQGFFDLHFLPLHFVGEVSDQAGYFTYYTHYPPLPNVVNGLLRELGIDSLYAYRMICGSLFIVGLACLAWAFAPLIGRWAAVCGLAFVGSSGFFIAYCTSLHHTWNFFFLGLFVFVFIRLTEARIKKPLYWLACWWILLLASLTSYEFILHAQVFAWVFLLITGQLRKHWKGLVVLATAPFAGVGLHFLQVVWALGWEQACRDALGFYHVRGGNWYVRWQYIQNIPFFIRKAIRDLFYWLPHALIMIPVLWFILVHNSPLRPTRFRLAIGLFLALALAATTWFVAMPYHVVRHVHTMGQFLPLLMASFGGALSLAFWWLLSSRVRLYQRFLALLFLLVVAYGQYHTIKTQLEFECDFPAVIAEAIGPDALPPKTGVITNTGMGEVAYFLRRPLWHAPYGAIPPVEFPECVPTFQKHLAQGWEIRYYLFTTLNALKSYSYLAKYCPGRSLKLPGTQHILVLFDIHKLHLPPAKRDPLPPRIAREQMAGHFPEWELEGFQRRYKKAMARCGR